MRPARIATSDIIHRKIPAGPRVLDLGCGDGERAIALAHRNFNQVTGLDAAQSLIDLAVRRAAKRRAEVAFVCGDPCATPFGAGSFDEVMLLGDLFGHAGTPRSDVLLLCEAGRVLKPGGTLHLSFSDGDWIRNHYRAEAVEGLSAGFIYRRRALSADGHTLRTEILSASEEWGIARRQSFVERLYAPREVTGLLHRLGFDAITYDAAAPPARLGSAPPQYTVHCRAVSAQRGLRVQRWNSAG